MHSITTFYHFLSHFNKFLHCKKPLSKPKIQSIQLSFQDDITSTDDSDESENDENFIAPSSQPSNHKQQLQQQHQQATQIVIQQQQNNHHQQHHQHQQRISEDDNKQLLLNQQQIQQTQNHNRLSEKILDNQKFLLESLSNLPQNLLQSWIQSGQLQVSVDEGEFSTNCRKVLENRTNFLKNHTIPNFFKTIQFFFQKPYNS